MRTTTRLAVVALAGLVGLVLPSAVDAQLGGFIRKKMGDKVAAQVGGGDKKPDAPAPKNASVGFTEEQFATYLKAQLAFYDDLGPWVAKRKGLDERRTAYQEKLIAWQSCTNQANGMMMQAGAQSMGTAMPQNPEVQRFSAAMAQKVMSLSPAEQKEFEAKLRALDARGRKAHANHDVAEEQRVLADFEKLVGVKPPQLGGADRARLEANADRAAQSHERMQAAEKKRDACGPQPQLSQADMAAMTEGPQSLPPKPQLDTYLAKAGLKDVDTGRMNEQLTRYIAWLDSDEGKSAKAGESMFDRHRDEVRKLARLQHQYANDAW